MDKNNVSELSQMLLGRINNCVNEFMDDFFSREKSFLILHGILLEAMSTAMATIIITTWESLNENESFKNTPLGDSFINESLGAIMKFIVLQAEFMKNNIDLINENMTAKFSH